MSREMFWQNVAANLVGSLLAGAAGLIVYRFLYGRFPALGNIVG